MKLIPLPAFQDNYLWVLHDGQRALVVGPGEGLQLDTILVTRHHPDHIGGVDKLREATGANMEHRYCSVAMRTVFRWMRPPCRGNASPNAGFARQTGPIAGLEADLLYT
jgi:glyoxylase-like metal-dependent hydrolase (beta-lactamase superfamily II)